MNLSEKEKNHPKFHLFKDGTLDLSEENGTIHLDEYRSFQTIQKVIIGPHIQEMGIWAFWNCRNLQEVDFNGTCITQILTGCFSRTSLKSIVLPVSISEIKSSFYNCQNLFSIVLLGVKRIYEYAFGYCPNLINIELTEQIEYIHPRAFNGSKHEKPITITCPQRFEEYFLERFPNAIFTRNV